MTPAAIVNQLGDRLLGRSFRPEHGENRMKNEGDVARARSEFDSRPSENLRFLLEQRFAWMNEFIPQGGKGIEVGAGHGLSRRFIEAKDFTLTDFADHPWLDVTNVDALATPFDSGSLDFVVSSNMIHHVPYPVRFLEEMTRILKPGGLLQTRKSMRRC